MKGSQLKQASLPVQYRPRISAKASPPSSSIGLPASSAAERTAMTRTHSYEAEVIWTGNQGSGTSGYKAYSRDHVIRAGSKPEIPGSSDPAFRGDPARYNPEDMLVASLSACHMLWYLHLCATNKIVVEDYR